MAGKGGVCQAVLKTRLINRATKEASRSSFRFQVGATVVKGGRVLASAHNALRYTSSNKHTRHTLSLHAEIAALLKASKKTDLKGSILFVSRLRRDGGLGMARPCAFCMSFIREVKVKKVVYTTDDNTVNTETL